jgi:peptide deformylase
MGILKIARLGHPVLLRKAAPMDPADLVRPEVQRLIDAMILTMRDAPGVGLAAPQVHESVRLFVMEPGERGGPESGLRVLVNPEVTPSGEERLELWEGCLSIPGVRGRTERWAEVNVRYLDRHGQEQHQRFQDFAAAVVQHETDHLDGVMFLERMPDLARLAFDEEYLRFHAPPPDDDDGE